MKMRLTAVMLVVLVVVLAAEQEAHAKRRGRGARKCRREKNKQWCNKEKVEDMIKDHPAVDKEKIKMAEKDKEQQSSCPAGKIGLRDEDVRDVNQRSLTPWVYVTNHTAASIRIPDTFVEAKCLCDGCLIYGPDGVSVENTKDYVNIPIKTGLPILERYDCRKGKCRERQVTYQVTVGCMCATRKRAIKMG
ncbi:PREDICTED: uncharacterized protein LOC109473382 [Branchiostoma belcheri]|uniref:Uncharacterized protein LOC109473382 n=1 Tax=Branchiostoma belcheri TaxID=7741 RepID=A0A6P4ZCH8_BRABE|nr:PREDICTED: uncharacterized protein LOC109473382 [Branchiostoma belcheri]